MSSLEPVTHRSVLELAKDTWRCTACGKETLIPRDRRGKPMEHACSTPEKTVWTPELWSAKDDAPATHPMINVTEGEERSARAFERELHQVEVEMRVEERRRKREARRIRNGRGR